jgi:hypothetical protein
VGHDLKLERLLDASPAVSSAMPDGSSVDTGMEATFPSTMAGPG